MKSTALKLVIGFLIIFSHFSYATIPNIDNGTRAISLVSADA